MPLLHISPIQDYIGPQLIGSFANTVLYTLEVVTVISTYRRSIQHKQERFYIKLLVVFNLFVDTIGSFAVCAGAYTFSVMFWGNTERAEKPHWTLVLSVLTNSIVALTVQGFLTYRYWRISSNWFVTLGIVALILFAFSATLHLVIVSSNPHRGPLDRVKDIRDVCMALAGSVATDIAINTALCYKLFHMETFNRATKILIHRIVTLAIGTGVVTSLVVIIILITFLITPLSRISDCFTLFLGRVYSLTMLYTLLHRESMAKETLGVVVDTTHAFHNMSETRPPPRSVSRSEGMIFAGHENSLAGGRSHSTSENDYNRDDLPKQTISCHNYAPSFQSNPNAF